MTTFTNDGVIALATQLGVQTLPLVLSIGPQQDSHRELELAQERARAELVTRRIIDAHGDADPDTAAAFFALAQPDCELAARIIAESGQVRVSIARRGETQVVAVRRGEAIEIHPMWSDGSGSSLAKPILDALVPNKPAQVVSLSALSSELAERFEAATSSGDYASAVYSLGVAETDATAYGLALASCHSYAEVVAYAYTDGVTYQSPGAAVVYDTSYGRIVAAPGIAPDQQLWSTLTPGTDHRVAQAISALIDSLPGRRWLP